MKIPGTTMLLRFWLIGMLILAIFGSSCKKEEPDEIAPFGYEAGEEWSGGAGTVFDTTIHAFSFPNTNLTAVNSRPFFTGNSFFRQNWVIAPSSTTGRDGLGPTYNALSCSGCHQLDGRGRPPLHAGDSFESMLIRISQPGQDVHGGPLPVPIYGLQLNNQAIPGVPAEGKERIAYLEQLLNYPDGTPYALRTPQYTVEQLGFGPLPGNTLLSPRIAPALCGMGLIEALDPMRLANLADPDDQNQDGISGKVNYVWNPVTETKAVGKFGLKANVPTLQLQVAGAFLGDMGITSSFFPQQNCPQGQIDCQQAPEGGHPEISDTLLDRVVFYTHHLAVPGRRSAKDPMVLAGKQLFLQIGCGKCHTPKHVTGMLAGYPELSGQTIYPYSDFLVHDMGAALADNRPDFDADGQEWRTPPLWGIGLVHKVNQHTFFLHDGRARNIEEAILWHGGEAAQITNAFKQLSKSQREAILKFLNSL